MDQTRTFEAARGLFKSQLRHKLYTAKAQDSRNASWESLRDVEEGFVKVYREGWREAISSWNLSDSEQLAALRPLLDDALKQAQASASQHFHELAADSNWIAAQIQEWVNAFSVDHFLGVKTP